jgi:cytochrome c553
MKAKRILLTVAGVLAVGASALAVFAGVESAAYSASLDKVYDVPVPAIAHSTDAAVLARGKHVADAIAACSSSNCHGADLGGGKTVKMGPVGHFTGTNISMGGLGLAYTDGELARLIRYGLKKDGRTVRFMPVQDFRWLPDDDVAAVVSYIRAAPAVDRENGPTDFGVLGKVLDRRDKFVIDVARRIDLVPFTPPAPRSPGADYGRYLAETCTGCHGEHFAGGPIPGAPSSMPIPQNLTLSEDGLAHWAYADFDHALVTGLRPDGSTINPFMPLESFGKLDDLEKHALWAYLQSVPPRPFGQR